MKITNWLKIVLDSLYDGILIADRHGIVVYVNPAYTRITKIKSEEIVGKRLLDIRPGSHLTNVILEGKKELGAHRKVGDIEYIVNMVPIYSNKNIIGGISILNEINDIYNLTEKLKTSHKIIEKLEENVKRLGNGRYYFEDIIAVDRVSLKTVEFAKRISQNESDILITGESGTGKELYASAIHNYSNRKNSPFVTVNCATIEKNLMESELFGYEAGAFTGAKKDGKMGLFQLANGGTLFLDEIGELEYELQGKLLRVLQEKAIRKIGGLKEIDVDVRLICATNRDLEKMVEEGRFRKDLYYRINIIPLYLEPLRARRGDILPLIEKFLTELNGKYRKNIEISNEVKNLLFEYEWSGNVRELRNIIEFLYTTTDTTTIEKENLPSKFFTKTNTYKKLLPLKQRVKEFEKEYIKEVLEMYEDNLEGKKRAAEVLGVSLATLYNKF